MDFSQVSDALLLNTDDVGKDLFRLVLVGRGLRNNTYQCVELARIVLSTRGLRDGDRGER